MIDDIWTVTARDECYTEVELYRASTRDACQKWLDENRSNVPEEYSGVHVELLLDGSHLLREMDDDRDYDYE